MKPLKGRAKERGEREWRERERNVFRMDMEMASHCSIGKCVWQVQQKVARNVSGVRKTLHQKETNEGKPMHNVTKKTAKKALRKMSSSLTKGAGGGGGRRGLTESSQRLATEAAQRQPRDSLK